MTRWNWLKSQLLERMPAAKEGNQYTAGQIDAYTTFLKLMNQAEIQLRGEEEIKSPAIEKLKILKEGIQTLGEHHDRTVKRMEAVSRIQFPEPDEERAAHG